METSNKFIKLNVNNDENKIDIKRSPEIIFGLRNFIGNAVKFSKNNVEVKLASGSKSLVVEIQDDGPGFPEDIIEILGEPYIKSKSKKVNTKSGTGLGTFLGKTLLERKGAKLDFKNLNSVEGGASVKIIWDINSLISSS